MSAVQPPPPDQPAVPPAASPYPPPGAPYPPQGAQYPPQGAQYPPAGAPYPPVGAQYPPAAGQYPPAAGQYPPAAGRYAPAPGQYAPASGPYGPPPPGQEMSPTGYPGMYSAPGAVGKIRNTGPCIALAFVTLGIYTVYWYYQVHTEMKNHSRDGLGGALALVISLFAGIVMPYITSAEVGGLYERRGQQAPVSGATGLWSFPGVFILVGPIVWFVKTNGALNDYWRSLGAV